MYSLNGFFIKFDIQKQPLLLLIMVAGYTPSIKTYSKTTFVTVNQDDQK